MEGTLPWYHKSVQQDPGTIYDLYEVLHKRGRLPSPQCPTRHTFSKWDQINIWSYMFE